jgi:hypothetical protein
MDDRKVGIKSTTERLRMVKNAFALTVTANRHENSTNSHDTSKPQRMQHQ